MKEIEIAKKITLLNPSVFLSVSGGKDSAVAAHYALALLEKAGFDRSNIVMIHAVTPLSLPENLEYVKKLANFMNVKLEIAQYDPRYGLDYIANGGGLPWIMNRWCMDKWKVRPLRSIMSKYRYPHVVTLGIRTSESLRRFNIYSDKEPLYFETREKRYV
ncbi:MAG: phosphoadenosine phosphosulfate reductase family protein [Sulfolobales archaeon]